MRAISTKFLKKNRKYWIVALKAENEEIKAVKILTIDKIKTIALR